MGTDAIVHAEIKVEGVWHHYSTCTLKRDLDLFDKMGWDGDEDSTIIPIAKPKGMPEDISLITKVDYNIWKNDAVCQSWFDASEIKQICEWYNGLKAQYQASLVPLDKQLGYLFGNSFQCFLEFRSDYPIEIEDIRWVFWFKQNHHSKSN